MTSRFKLYLIHGAGGSKHVWQYQTAFFPGAVAISLPGHPEGEGHRTIDAYAAWLHDLLLQRGEQQPVLVGHSMGGAISLLYALLYPQEVRALVLVSTGARLRVSPYLFETIGSDYEQAIRLMVDWAFAPGVKPRLREKSAEMLRQVSPAVTHGDFEACNNFDVMQRVHEIQVPTLVICGTADRLTPVKYSEYLAAGIRRARLHLIEGAGHMVMLERPREFNRALQQFLDSLLLDSPKST